MKKITLLAFLLITSTAPLFGTVFTGTVTGDTYLRSDAGLATPQNGDTDNEILVGSNGPTNNLHGLLRFDVSSIVNDVNTIGGGNFANLTINSASLQVFERRGFARTVNVNVNDYAFAFDPATATWNTPATGDTTLGGTVGTTLGSQSITWDATSDNQDATVSLSTSLLKTSVENHLSNLVHFILTTDTQTTGNFFSITSDQSATTSRHAKLSIDYTVTPSGGPQLTLDPATPDPDYAFPYSATGTPLTRTLRFKNTSSSGTVTIQSVAFTNDAGGFFTLGSVSPAAPVTLAVGETIDVPVTASGSASGSFTGSLFIDTDAAGQDKNLAVTASFYNSGQLFTSNASMTTNLAGWSGGSSFASPGLVSGIAGDGMARVRGHGDPVQPLVGSSLAQSATVPDNLADWCLDFRFTPVAPGSFADYTGQTADGNFGDRTFQFVVQATDAVPSPDLTDTLDDETLLNIAYFPDGITTGGTAGFYVFNQTFWQLIDFNGDGSALVLAGSTDVDTDADTANGVGDGSLNAAAGDTVNVYRMTVKGTGFGTGSASYSITLTGPGGLNKTATGLTAYHSRDITTHMPDAVAFISTDSSAASNASSGFCPSFWVDEVGWFAVDRPEKRLLLFNGPTFLRSLNGATPVTHSLDAFNDGTGSVDLSASLTGASAVTVTAPVSSPVTLPAGTSAAVTISFDPSGIVAPNTADAGTLTVTSTDPLLPSADYPFVVTKVTDANLVANGDFETTTANAPFPAAWTLTGTPSSATSFLPAGGSAVSLAVGQGVLQDVIPSGATALANFQADFAFQIGSETQAHRIRIEGNNGGDHLSIRLTANTPSADLIEVFNAGTWTTALSGLTIDPNTTYHMRVTGRDFGLAGRTYTIGFSSDGLNYTSSSSLAAFHAAGNVAMETITFECGATAGSSLLVDNVSVTELPDNTFATWMDAYTFAPGADITAGGDADNDGIANLVENVLGTPPNAPSTGLIGITGTSGTAGFSHPLNPDLASDVSYSYEWSTDLAEWKASGESNTGGTVVDIVAGAPVVDVVAVTATVTTGNAPRLFVRLTAVQAAP